ncbi:MAG: polyphosphate kinase 1 [Chloroflexota bacterium]
MIDFDLSKKYINRELSLLEFQRRVLEEAKDEQVPLLERLKYLAIFGSNMDEFFMVRVSGIRKLIESGVTELSLDGKSAREQLVLIRKKSIERYEEAQKIFKNKIQPKLNKSGIHLMEYSQLTISQKEKVDNYFIQVVFPILTPLALDPGHPFPHISNLSLNLAIVIRDHKGKERFSRLKVPDTLPRFVPIKKSSGGIRKDGSVPENHFFIPLEQVITENLGLLFPGMEVVSASPFRILRDADIEIQEIEADDLLETMQQNIRRRKFGSVVQVAINDNMQDNIRQVLIDNLEVNATDVYTMSGFLGMVNFWQIYSSVERIELKFPAHKPEIPKEISRIITGDDFYHLVSKENILLHHPYDSFSSVIDFLNISARDPNVLAIKQTLYRTGKDSPIIESLVDAAERGKQVAVLVELKARFDEESNIGWARKLEQIGVHVVYGLIGLKTHCKVVMVVRKEGDGIRRYIHLSTGNYNAGTSRMYEDIGMFTADEKIGEDVTDLFNHLTGYSTKKDYQKLLVAPLNLRSSLVDMINKEVENVKLGKPGHLIFKVNSIADKEIIDLLYFASQSGVKVDLLVRGVCCLRPELPGISDNIRVKSVIGRFLEHSRIFYFLNGGNERIYIGSADLMTRNLSHRVEVLFPIEEKEHIQYLRERVLLPYIQDNLKAYLMTSDGNYKRGKSTKEIQYEDIQKILMSR